MPGMSIILFGEGAFTDEQARFGTNFVFHEDPHLKVVRLENGTKSGKSAVIIGFEHEGKYITIQTTLSLFKAAAKAMETRDEMEGRPT